MVEPQGKALTSKRRGRILVCFAVKEEAKFFLEPEIDILVTGMGRAHAERRFRAALERQQPRLVLSCGFAGGLNPALQVGSVVFHADEEAALAPELILAGAIPGSFHFSDRVAVTVAEKKLLREKTGADAVEMESEVIRTLCRNAGIPSATIRVISDTANENLPLDFNALMSPEETLDYWKLAWALLKSPRKIGSLLRFQRQIKGAAQKLSNVLRTITRPAN
jgi:adenosylhomocysteine nucleosidase